MNNINFFNKTTKKAIYSDDVFLKQLLEKNLGS